VLAGSQNGRRVWYVCVCVWGGDGNNHGGSLYCEARQSPLKLDKWGEKFTYSGYKFTFDG